MLFKTCDCCNFTTVYKHVFDRHIKSKKHIDNLSSIMSNRSKFVFQCKKCSKSYKSRSGLYKHSIKCKPTEMEQLIPPQVKQHIAVLENEIMELKKNVVLSPTTTAVHNHTGNTHNETNTNSHNNNTTNNNYINYLNINCQDAMSIKEFVETLVFTKADIEKLVSDHYDKVVSKFIIERLECIPPDQRPLHCIAPTTDTSGSFAVKTADWKEEKQHQLETHIRDVEDDDEYAKMTLPTTIDDINNKVYDTYEEERKGEPKLEGIRKKMIGSGRSDDKIRILNNLMKSEKLKLPNVP
jgi:hypothetical protein